MKQMIERAIVVENWSEIKIDGSRPWIGNGHVWSKPCSTTDEAIEFLKICAPDEAEIKTDNDGTTYAILSHAMPATNDIETGGFRAATQDEIEKWKNGDGRMWETSLVLRIETR